MSGVKMNSFETTIQIAKEKSLELCSKKLKYRNTILKDIFLKLGQSKEEIIQANQKDRKFAKSLVKNKQLSLALYQRLCLDFSKIDQMRQYPKKIIKLQDPIKKLQYKRKLAQGLFLKRYSVPIGILLVIFESRPEVLVQISSLAIKSGNALLLKGGSEAQYTNRVLFEIINEVLKTHQLEGLISLLTTRLEVHNLIKKKGIDLIIPRGSQSLVRNISKNTNIPVLGHADGICHIYVDQKADPQKALSIVVDGKTQYPAVCNATETLLLHHKLKESLQLKILKALVQKGVELRLTKNFISLAKKNSLPYKLASERDWSSEYNDLVIAVKDVTSPQEAISHINHYGSQHTDCIITEDKEIAENFLWMVDSAGVYHNASTRFADGGVYGFGAEVGVSTNKFHARGPVGLEGLMTYKYILKGNGHIKATYKERKN